MEDALTIIPLIVVPIIFLTGLILKIFPPKKINYFYGYRTSRSMKNEHNWKIANAYSANIIIIGTAAIVFLFGILKIASVPEQAVGIIMGIGLAVIAFLTILLTEIKLNKLEKSN